MFGPGYRWKTLQHSTFATTTSTSTLMFHLKENHDISDKNFQDSISKLQKTMDRWVSCNEEGFTKTEEFCVRWATCGLSYCLVDNQRFRKTFSLSYPSNINRKIISLSMIKLSEKFDSAVKDKIRGFPCTLCFDGWTNQHQKIVNLVVICEGFAYYLNSVLVEHNEATLKNILDEGKQIVKEMGGILVAVSGDIFSGVVAAISTFCPENPQVIGFRCLAHSIQLTISDLLDKSPLKRVSETIIPLFVKHFSGPDHKKKLKDLQILSGKSENGCLKPIKPNATRWDSTYQCICRIIKLKEFLPLVGLTIQETDWELLNFSKIFLGRFKVCTDELQKDSSTIVDCVKLWNQLVDHIGTLSNQSSDNYDTFFYQARVVMIKRTTKHMSISLHVVVIAFLNPSQKSDYEDLVRITDKLLSMVEYYFQELGLEAVLVKSKMSKMSGQMAAYVLGGGLWEQKSDENIINYWTRQVFRAPELARVALFACTTSNRSMR